jgi:plastocyanin
MIDLEPDDIDQAWRDGLTHLRVVPITNGEERVEARLARRRRARRMRTSLATLLAVLVVLGVIGVIARPRPTRAQHVTTTGPVTHVTVDDGVAGTLSIRFPGRQTGDGPQRVVLPAGRVQFTIHYYFTHNLVLRGVPDFRGSIPRGKRSPYTVKTTVTLRPGRYLLYCTIPGHQTAGEVAWIVVRDAAVSPPTP